LGDVNIAGDNASGQLHVVTTDGAKVWHTIRYSNGSWSPFGDGTAQAGSPSCDISMVGAALIGASLHVVVTTDDQCNPIE
jgi:hypothetical protein